MKSKYSNYEIAKEYMKQKYGEEYKSPFTEEEIKWWVDFGINVILKPGKKIIEAFREHFNINEEK